MSAFIVQFIDKLNGHCVIDIRYQSSAYKHRKTKVICNTLNGHLTGANDTVTVSLAPVKYQSRAYVQKNQSFVTCIFLSFVNIVLILFQKLMSRKSQEIITVMKGVRWVISSLQKFANFISAPTSIFVFIVVVAFYCRPAHFSFLDCLRALVISQ